MRSTRDLVRDLAEISVENSQEAARSVKKLRDQESGAVLAGPQSRAKGQF
jgi:hypothetical protein